MKFQMKNKIKLMTKILEMMISITPMMITMKIAPLITIILKMNILKMKKFHIYQ